VSLLVEVEEWLLADGCRFDPLVMSNGEFLPRTHGMGGYYRGDGDSDLVSRGVGARLGVSTRRRVVA
jgi:hypothetical protein